MIEPIDNRQRQRVIEETARCVDLASELYNRPFAQPSIDFDLRGRCAGMYQVRRAGDGTVERRIRYNPWLFAKYFDDNISDTVAHEVAHYIVEQTYRRTKVKPHGPEWRAVVSALGGTAKATADFDLQGIPQRQRRTFAYRCSCRQHRIGVVRHNRVAGQRARYLCRHCGDTLKPCDEGVGVSL